MFHLGSLQKAIFNKANKLFMQSGLPIQVEQIPVLMTLHSKGDMSQQEAADLCQRDKSSIQRTITSLIKHGYVETAEDPFDKRRNIVHLTKDGRLITRKIERKIIEIESKLFVSLSENEKTDLIEWLNKMEKMVSETEL